MTKEPEETAYRTYCRDRLVVSESAEKLETDNSREEKPKVKKVKRPVTLIIK